MAHTCENLYRDHESKREIVTSVRDGRILEGSQKGLDIKNFSLNFNDSLTIQTMLHETVVILLTVWLTILMVLVWRI